MSPPERTERNDTRANRGYWCHLPLTSRGSSDHVFCVPRELHGAVQPSSGSSGNGHREARRLQSETRRGER
uniref:Uncharacterized protein n=1 Tax=Knipowitschia caucasica TaxID=637954 RepID=A0AAV2JS44_KNICA